MAAVRVPRCWSKSELPGRSAGCGSRPWTTGRNSRVSPRFDSSRALTTGDGDQCRGARDQTGRPGTDALRWSGFRVGDVVFCCAIGGAENLKATELIDRGGLGGDSLSWPCEGICARLCVDRSS